jgi:ABC-type branched-subunit amino acid transport system substrate-binding protein
MSKTKILSIFCVSLFLLLLLGNFTIGGDAYAQKSAKKIKIGMALDLTGLYQDSWGLIAAQDYIKWVNETRYIPGVELEVMWSDTGGSLDKGLAFFKHEKEAGCMVVQHATTGENVALKKLLEEAKIIGFSQTVTDEPIYEPPAWNFCGIMGTKGHANCFLHSVKIDWAKRNMNRPAVVGCLGWDNIIGKISIKYVKENYERFGLKFGTEALISPAATEFRSQWRALRGAKCDYVMISVASSQVGGILKQRHELEMTDIKTINPAWNVSEAAWGSLALPASMLQGAGMIDYYGQINEVDKPGAWLLKQCADTHRKYHGKELDWRTGSNYIMFYAINWQLVEAIKEAAARVGPEKVNSEEIKYSIEHLKRKDVGGLFGGSDFTEYPGDRIGMTHFRYCDIVDKPGGPIRVPTTDWVYMDYRPTGK